MKPHNNLQLLCLMCAFSLLLGGCLIKPAPVPAHYFVLAPIQPPGLSPTVAKPFSIEVGAVKMPSYLLRDSMVVRKSANEIYYFDDALWAERLDRNVQRTLADNLTSLLSSNRNFLLASNRSQILVKISVDVKQFDVDAQGQGTLTAGWRLSFPNSDKPTKFGQAHLTKSGGSPVNPQVIAATLNALILEFSKELAEAVTASIQEAGNEPFDKKAAANSDAEWIFRPVFSVPSADANEPKQIYEPIITSWSANGGRQPAGSRGTKKESPV